MTEKETQTLRQKVKFRGGKSIYQKPKRMRTEVRVITLRNFSALLFRPTLVGEELYTQTVFLFRQFSPINIFIVKGCECYH